MSAADRRALAEVARQFALENAELCGRNFGSLQQREVWRALRLKARRAHLALVDAQEAHARQRSARTANRLEAARRDHALAQRFEAQAAGFAR